MVFVVFVHVKVDAALALVCIAVVQNLLYQFNLLYYMARCMRLYAGWQYIEHLHGLVVAQCVVLNHLHGLQLLQTCFLGNLVLALIGIVLQMAYIGYVAYVTYLIT